MELQAKREREKQNLACMVALYCRGKAHTATKGALCSECGELLAYAERRTQHCPHMKNKTFCSRCPTPCYRPDMRAKVQKVMRYAGPRMLLRHPLLCLRHALAHAGALCNKDTATTQTQERKPT